MHLFEAHLLEALHGVLAYYLTHLNERINTPVWRGMIVYKYGIISTAL
jgi:hypothetical protein